MHILITAGPTREAIDPVRYLSNHSSGKMGYALAEVAAEQEHHVTLISGPCSVEVPDGIDFLPVESAQDMYQAVERYIHKADIAIFAAAVADYRPAFVPQQKIKKSSETLTLELVKNPDILGSCRSQFDYQGTLVGFAAETENLEDNARTKLKKKQCDLIVANDVSRNDIGFNSDDNEVLLVYPQHSEPLDKADKHHLAHVILEKALLLTS